LKTRTKIIGVIVGVVGFVGSVPGILALITGMAFLSVPIEK
jgi:hypothetical protein